MAGIGISIRRKLMILEVQAVNNRIWLSQQTETFGRVQLEEDFGIVTMVQLSQGYTKFSCLSSC